MNSRYILIAMIALVPMVMNGMNGMHPMSPEYIKARFARARTERYAELNQEYTRDPKGYLKGLNQEYTRKDWKAAENLGKAKNSHNIKEMLDNKDCTEWNPFTPNPEKSWIGSVGSQLSLGFLMTFAGFITTILVKKFLTPKSERDREDARATMEEQTVLKNLQSVIENLTQSLPVLHKQLAIETNPEKIEYLKTVIANGETVLQEKIAMHEALSRKFDEDQKYRYAEQLRRVNAVSKA